MSDHPLFQPRWRQHLNCAIRAQGLLSNPMSTYEQDLTSDYLAIDGVRLVLRNDIRVWSDENTPSMKMRSTPDFRLIIGSDDEQDFMLFTLRWM